MTHPVTVCEAAEAYRAAYQAHERGCAEDRQDPDRHRTHRPMVQAREALLAAARTGDGLGDAAAVLAQAARYRATSEAYQAELDKRKAALRGLEAMDAVRQDLVTPAPAEEVAARDKLREAERALRDACVLPQQAGGDDARQMLMRMETAEARLAYLGQQSDALIEAITARSSSRADALISLGWSGEGDPRVWARTRRPRLRVVFSPDKADAIRWVQTALRFLVAPTLDVDGRPGPATRLATRRFQEQLMAPDLRVVPGEACAATISALAAAFAMCAPGERSPSLESANEFDLNALHAAYFEAAGTNATITELIGAVRRGAQWPRLEERVAATDGAS